MEDAVPARIGGRMEHPIPRVKASPSETGGLGRIGHMRRARERRGHTSHGEAAAAAHALLVLDSAVRLIRSSRCREREPRQRPPGRTVVVCVMPHPMTHGRALDADWAPGHSSAGV